MNEHCAECGAYLANADDQARHQKWHRDLLKILADLNDSIMNVARILDRRNLWR